MSHQTSWAGQLCVIAAIVAGLTSAVVAFPIRARAEPAAGSPWRASIAGVKLGQACETATTSLKAEGWKSYSLLFQISYAREGEIVDLDCIESVSGRVVRAIAYRASGDLLDPDEMTKRVLAKFGAPARIRLSQVPGFVHMSWGDDREEGSISAAPFATYKVNPDGSLPGGFEYMAVLNAGSNWAQTQQRERNGAEVRDLRSRASSGF